MAEVLRIDVTIDGEPVGSVEAREDRHDGWGQRRLRITLGDTSGETVTYTHPKLRGLPNMHLPLVREWWAGYALNVAQSAFAKSWWHRRGRR